MAIRKLAVQSIHSIADLELTYEIDNKRENDVNQKVKDPIYLRPIAKVFPDIAAVFGKHNRGVLIRPAFVFIFTSDSKESYRAVLEQLPEILPHLIPEESNSADDLKFKEVIMKQMKKWWQEESSWRDLSVLIDVIARTQEYFPVVAYNNFYLDAIFKHLAEGNYEIQKVSAKAICLLIASNHLPTKREEAFKRLTKLTTGSYYDRKRYLLFCDNAVEYLAPSILTAINFYKQFIKLSGDKIPNIRLGYSKIVVKAWAFACDKVIREEIMGSLKRLKGDVNTEVRNCSEKMYEHLINHSAEIMKGDEQRKKRHQEHERNELRLQGKGKNEQEEKKRDMSQTYKDSLKEAMGGFQKRGTPQPRKINKKPITSTRLTNPMIDKKPNGLGLNQQTKPQAQKVNIAQGSNGKGLKSGNKTGGNKVKSGSLITSKKK